jgi:methyltransferase (TIGR00027 family)
MREPVARIISIIKPSTRTQDPQRSRFATRLVDSLSDFYKSFVEGLERMPASLRLQRRAYLVMRSRYTEDCLGESVTRGIRQYIILGAGLDTFGYRQPSWAKSLRVFEVDHLATQSWKKTKLAARPLPQGVTRPS